MWWKKEWTDVKMMYVEVGKVVTVEVKGENNRGEKTRRNMREEKQSRKGCDNKNKNKIISIM